MHHKHPNAGDLHYQSINKRDANSLASAAGSSAGSAFAARLDSAAAGATVPTITVSTDIVRISRDADVLVRRDFGYRWSRESEQGSYEHDDKQECHSP